MSNALNESFAAIAASAWKGAPPDWVTALAHEADRIGEAAAAQRIGYSRSVVWEILRAAYSASTARVERAVRAALMRDAIDCPVLGEIDGASCISHQKAPYSSANPLKGRLYRACRRCPHSASPGDR